MYLFAFFLVLFEFTAYSTNDMIMPGMIQVIHYFHATQHFVAFSLSFYILGNSAFLLFVGSLSECYGKRLIILSGNALFLIFSVAIIYSNSIHEFIAWRFFQGIGLSIIPIGYAIIHQSLDDKRAIKLTALMANISVLSPLAGPLFGSLIVSRYSWKYVFVATSILCFISLVGLAFTMPKKLKLGNYISLKSFLMRYAKILENNEFRQGTICIVLINMNILIWIGQSPNIILVNLHLDFTHYVIYQLISIGGFTLSSIGMQYVLDHIRLYIIVKVGNILFLLGLAISFLGTENINIVIAGLFINTLGMGFVNGCIVRLIMTIKNFSQGMLATFLAFTEALLFAFGLMVTNVYMNYFKFSLWSYTLLSFIFGLLAFIMITQFISSYKDRPWY